MMSNFHPVEVTSSSLCWEKWIPDFHNNNHNSSNYWILQSFQMFHFCYPSSFNQFNQSLLQEERSILHRFVFPAVRLNILCVYLPHNVLLCMWWMCSMYRLMIDRHSWMAVFHYLGVAFHEILNVNKSWQLSVLVRAAKSVMY